MLLTTKIARFVGPTYARFARVVVPIAVRAAHTINVNITFDPTRPSEKLQITGLDTENIVVNRLDQHNTPLLVDQTVTGETAVSIDSLLSLGNEQICKLLEQHNLHELSQFIREHKLTGANLAYGVESVQDLTELGLNTIQARTLFRLIQIWMTTGVPPITAPEAETPAGSISIAQLEELLRNQTMPLITEDDTNYEELVGQHSEVSPPGHDSHAPDTLLRESSELSHLQETIKATSVNKRPEMVLHTQLDTAYTNARWGNDTTALEYLMHSAESEPLAQAYLSILLDKGCNGLERHRSNAIYYAKLALPWLLEHASAGNPFAQYNLGFCYTDGRGVPQDDVKAAQLYELASLQGHQGAGINLAISHELGEGVEKNAPLAVEYFKFYAAMEHPHALKCLAHSYEHGIGVAQNHTIAVQYYIQAAKLGHADAQYCLGVCLLEGKGIAQDVFAAQEHFEAAAKQGHNGALNVLGAPHFRGAGTFN